MSEPKRLTVEYNDGSTRTLDFSKVDKQTREALTKLGLCPVPALVGTSKHYVLLQWDGWQEVVGMDKDTVELLRYYVIRRIEDRGRLSFEAGVDDPELFIVKRTPRELTGVIIAGTTGIKVYPLKDETERWEGIFEAGGKIEYMKYDKTDPRFQGLSGEPERITRLQDSLKNELAKKQLVPATLLAFEETRRIQEYADIAKAMGIRGKEKQEDVYGFVEFLVKQLAASKM